MSLPAGYPTRFSSAVAPDGALLLTFLVNDNGGEVNAVARVDEDGTLAWAFEYDLPGLQTPTNAPVGSGDCLATADGGLLVGVKIIDATTPTTSAGVLRLRPDGTPLWARNYGIASISASWSTYLSPSSEGGFHGMQASITGARVFRAGAGGDVGPCAGIQAPVVASPLALSLQPFGYTYEAYPGVIAPDPLVVPSFDPTSSTSVCGLPVAPASSFCLAKVNSQGCTPKIGSSGTASLSGPGITVTAGQVLNGKTGLLFWGRTASGNPFQGGLKCVANPSKRTPAQDSGGSATGSDCTGAYAFTFDPAYMASQGIAAGDTIYCQYWSRDPQSASTTGLTDARQFTVSP